MHGAIYPCASCGIYTHIDMQVYPGKRIVMFLVTPVEKEAVERYFAYGLSDSAEDGLRQQVHPVSELYATPMCAHSYVLM